MVTMAIFKTSFTDKELRKIIFKQDATRAPLGSGGYSIKSPEENKFYFDELDLAPAKRYLVRIKKGQTWTENNFSCFFSSLLSSCSENFSFHKKSFPDPSSVRKAFDAI